LINNFEVVLPTQRFACGEISERLIELGLDLLASTAMPRNNDGETGMEDIKDIYANRDSRGDLEGIQVAFKK
jgi:hypothetical protein